MPSEPLEDDALNAMRDYALGTTPTSPAGVEMSHADAVNQARIMVGRLVGEVDRLRAELQAETEDCQTLQEAYMRAGEDAGNYLLTIEAVADLHQEAAGFCCTCEAAVWPCDTARALRHRPRGTPMNEDLTAAEQAAASALADRENDEFRRDHGCRDGRHADGTECVYGDGGAVAADYADTARAVVAAVRGPLLEEAADLIGQSDRLRSLTDDHMGDIEMAADELRAAARQAGEEQH